LLKSYEKLKNSKKMTLPQGIKKSAIIPKKSKKYCKKIRAINDTTKKQASPPMKNDEEAVGENPYN
jgi:hypothetical protein